MRNIVQWCQKRGFKTSKEKTVVILFRKLNKKNIKIKLANKNVQVVIKCYVCYI